MSKHGHAFSTELQRQAIDAAAFRSFICSLAMSRPISLQVQTCKQKLRETGDGEYGFPYSAKPTLRKNNLNPKVIKYNFLLSFWWNVATI
ncbi:hypothetical protein [Bradyrhizobium sp. CSA112]|uniref:hypothetical protein n=1 Tax=Bradyrhizobium sp. CSA112 TaxID=2699170 RepID=UPI0023B11E0B|nr:hypothetical protein [Bradyrhizobium sp. CSA112]